jgi:transposase
VDVVFRRCCGIDVHKCTVAACVSLWEENGAIRKDKRIFGTTTGELRCLAEWLSSHGITHVAMEATGVYWEPVWNVLDSNGDWELRLINPEHCKGLRGKKTDLKDGDRISELLQHGLLNASFVPPSDIRALRDLTRHRVQLQQRRSTLANRIQKLLEKGNIKLASVATDVLGVSGRAILNQLAGGEQDPRKLAELARSRLRGKMDELVAALEGCLQGHHQFLLRELLQDLSQVEGQVARTEQEIAKRMVPFEDVLKRLETIKGVNRVTAWSLVAEMGIHMEQFPTADHLASWAGVCPGNNESGGKRKSGKTRQGNRWLRRALCEAAWAAAHSKDNYLSAQFKRLAVRRGGKRALMAVANTILRIAYHLIAHPCVYRELGSDYFDRGREQQLTRRLVKRLEGLGHEVVLRPATG